ncbi:MAG: 2,3-bisphosphoglycerate-independent phosphoglycerate mutase [Clostridia bacterium]|nr:2,3-bisphosphoglycerate-independent phosphoglycerate mutase [Clostridia bacterium]
MKKLTALIIMDGYGLSQETEGNAIGPDCSPYVRFLRQNYPNSTLDASGLAVGLPEGQMGNSEVGHLNMGAGRVIYQDLTRITKEIKEEKFFQNPALIKACQKAKENKGKLHLMGLMSDGGVHSHITHVFALLELAKRQGLDDVFVHCYMDGRDTSPTSGAGYVKQLEDEMARLGIGHVATVSGRFYGMDRDNRWDRVEKAYDMLTLGIGEKAESAQQVLLENYAKGTTDEFILPTVITKDGKPCATIENGDAVIFFNFRPDRAREMTRAFTQDGFDGFSLKGKARKVSCWVCMSQYDEKFVGVEIAYPNESYENTLGQYLASQNKTQLRIAETEKYAHVTFFFNGGVELANEGETRVLIASPKVATYDLQPEMSALEVTEKAKKEIEKEKYDVMILNFANCDMVGHTGVAQAVEKAVATVDDCVRQVVECILTNGGRVFVTADHGNAEKLLEDGKPFTAHTTNKVPFILVDSSLQNKVTLKDGALCDIAPTLLYSMGLEQPAEMTGQNLIVEKE